MLRKLKVPLALYDFVYFDIRGSGKPPRYMQLTKLDMVKGVLEWEMTSDRGEVIVGNATAEIKNPALSEFQEMWVKPCIPIKMHITGGALRIDMIWQIPNACYIRAGRGSPYAQMEAAAIT